MSHTQIIIAHGSQLWIKPLPLSTCNLSLELISTQSLRGSLSLSLPQPGIVPKATHSGDTRNFEHYPEDGWFNVAPLKDRDVLPFKDF
jgi:hypothetical protein